MNVHAEFVDLAGNQLFIIANDYCRFTVVELEFCICETIFLLLRVAQSTAFAHFQIPLFVISLKINILVRQIIEKANHMLAFYGRVFSAKENNSC